MEGEAGGRYDLPVVQGSQYHQYDYSGCPTRGYTLNLGVTGSLAYADDHRELLEAVGRGHFEDLDRLITRRIGLEDLVEKGIMGLINEKDEMGENSSL